ncbi:hypothetical protein COLO4_13355 [Corchorus olitorius]|uniref:Uncharacterized protein n=1 Tax=Corchorus olitorius TaxID=93759 RepID=A0A1R3JWV2_9ROSI|nr:hypothetical protein COLO4_13355 [Corchorus olitorius]
MWTSLKQKLERWRRGQASANNVSNKKTTANRREKGTKARVIGKWYCPWSRANHLPVASRLIQPELDDKSHNHLGLVYWSDEGKAANLFNLLPTDILFEEILVKISFFKYVRVECMSYQNFVSKCATVGNMRAIAALKSLGSFFISVDGETYFLNERWYASYFLGMILFESPSTREEAGYCFAGKGQSPDSESHTYFRRNARWITAGYSTLDQFKYTEWIGFDCSFRNHYELLRLASVAAFSGK